MKNYKLLSIILIVLSTVLYTGCSSDDSDGPIDPGNVITGAEAKLTFNGAGYTNKAVTLSNGVSQYSVPDTATIIIFSGKVDSDSLYFSIIFKGNQTGAINWNDDNGAIIYKNGTSGYSTFLGIDQGTTTISTYGGVSSKVEGNISGKLIDAVTQAELNVNGTFSATRLPDIN